MQHLEGSGTPVLYIGRTVVEGNFCDLAAVNPLQLGVSVCLTLKCYVFFSQSVLTSFAYLHDSPKQL
jgi:hypothetical protein